MKLVVKMDLAQGRGSISWKGATWRRSWRVCVTLGGLLFAGNFVVDQLPQTTTQIKAASTKQAAGIAYRYRSLTCIPLPNGDTLRAWLCNS